MAINIDGVEESSLLLAFETIMPILINNVDHQTEVTISADGTFLSSIDGASTAEQQQQIQNAFDICNLVESKLPTVSTVNEYREALFRRMKQPQLAFQSYYDAWIKSKQKLNGEECNRLNHNSKAYVDLVSGFVLTSILVAAAAREAGHDLKQQMEYLSDAEQVAVPLLSAHADDMDEQSQESFRDRIVELYNNIGIAEKKRGSLERAQNFFRKALVINPSDGHALVQLASIDESITSNVKKLDPEYVSHLFDGYSSRFESELVDVLQYKGHSLIFEALPDALKKLGKSPLSIKRIIDLGCGTGLLGELIANDMPWVELSGVDLSHRMIDISRERKSKTGRDVYNASLSQGDAATYLSALEMGTIDCILASDMIIYVGDISSLLDESYKCLVNDGGLVGFTVEIYDAESGFRLQKSGRFGHSRAYIEQAAKLNGFEVLLWEDCVLRQQGGVDVRGASVILRKT